MPRTWSLRIHRVGRPRGRSLLVVWDYRRRSQRWIFAPSRWSWWRWASAGPAGTTSASTAWFNSSVPASRTSPPRRPGRTVSRLQPSRSRSISSVSPRRWSRSCSSSGWWCRTAPEAQPFSRPLSTCRHHPPLEPFQVPPHYVELEPWLPDAVPLSRVHHHRDRHVAPLECRVQLVALRDRYAQVVLAVLDEGRRRHRFDAEDGGAILPQLRGVPKLTAEIGPDEPGDVRYSHVRDQVRDARAHGRGVKPGGLGYREGRQIPAVTPPHHAQPIAVRDSALHQRVDAGHRVPEVAAAPVAHVRVPELAAVTAAPADVGTKHREAGGREGRDRVRAHTAGERLREARGRAAVQDREQRHGCARPVPCRVSHETLDLPPVERPPLNRLRPAERDGGK